MIKNGESWILLMRLMGSSKNLLIFCYFLQFLIREARKSIRQLSIEDLKGCLERVLRKVRL